MSKYCSLCKEDLILKYGKTASFIPLFKPTSNKEFISKPGASETVIADLARAIGVRFSKYAGCSAKDKRSACLCKKCARKIKTCHSYFIEIASAFDENDENLLATPKVDGGRVKRIFSSSPSGLTPSRKRRAFKQVPGADSSLCQSLSFQDEDQHLTSAIDGKIANSMSLPGEEQTKVVKVRFSKHFLISLGTYDNCN